MVLILSTMSRQVSKQKSQNIINLIYNKMEEIKQIELSNRLFILSIVLIGAITISYIAGVVLNIISLPVFQSREITITGTGKVYVVPDIATVDISMVNTGNEKSDIPVMIQKNTDDMNALIGDLKALGIDEKDIKTTQYSLEPQYNWTENEGRVFIGYKITNTILVTIRDFTKIGDVLSKAATERHSDSIGNISFGIEDPEKVRREAREKAIEQAKTKAESIAKSAGLRLGRVLNVYDSNSSYYYDAAYEKGLGGSSSVPSPEIQPGQSEITANVSVVYRIH